MSDPVDLMRQAVRAGGRPALDFEHAALIVVDMQHYQAREGSIVKLYGAISPAIGEYYLHRVRTLAEPNTVRLLQRFRAGGGGVIFTCFASACEDESDLPGYIREGNRASLALSGEALIPQVDDPAAGLLETMQPGDGEVVLQKSRSGAFVNTRLDALLRERGVEQVVVCGVLTHACVENTVRVAIDLGYTVFVVDDACATLDPALHEHALAAMELLSAHVVDTVDLCPG